MDLVIILVLMAIVILVFKRFSSFIYFVGIVDIFLRTMTYIKQMLNVKEISNFIGKYIPSSIPSILGNYSEGILYDVLMWLYIIGMIIFLSYLIRTFFKKK